MNRISVFCGSSPGNQSIFREKAYELGQIIARRNIELVYGGTEIGLMGAVAEGTLSESGKAIGILPNFLKDREIAHPQLSELILVDTMHERKVKMHEFSDGVIALPGGFGTMEELFEMLTWGQLGIHKKPIGILNINGFYDQLNLFLENMVAEGFLSNENKQMLIIEENPEKLLDKFKSYEHPDVERLINEKIKSARGK